MGLHRSRAFDGFSGIWLWNGLLVSRASDAYLARTLGFPEYGWAYTVAGPPVGFIWNGLNGRPIPILGVSAGKSSRV